MFSRSTPRLAPSYICGKYHRYGKQYCDAHHTRVDMMDNIVKLYLSKVRDEVVSKSDYIQSSLKGEISLNPQQRKSAIEDLNIKIKEAQNELQITKRQRIRDIIRNPDNEDILNETYDELEQDLYNKIDGLKNQINLFEDNSGKKDSVVRNTNKVVEIFDKIIEKEELSEFDIKNIVSKIYVYNNHIDIQFNSDIESLIATPSGDDEIDLENRTIELFKDEITFKAVHQNAKTFELNVKQGNKPLYLDVDTSNGIKKNASGDPLEIYTDAEGEVIFKKYSPIGELSNFAGQYAEVLHKDAGIPIVVMDNDHVIAASGISKREVLERRVTKSLEELMENRQIHIKTDTVPSMNAIEGYDRQAEVVYPIIYGGDVSGAIAMIESDKNEIPSESDIKLLQVAAAFLGKQME
jgi:stage V sporulation protein T